jgi:hypothetical protein
MKIIPYKGLEYNGQFSTFSPRYPVIPISLRGHLINWAKKEKFPIGDFDSCGRIYAIVENDEVSYSFEAMPAFAWKDIDYIINKGEKAAFFLGNWSFFCSWQVSHKEGFRNWTPKRKVYPLDVHPDDLIDMEDDEAQRDSI